MWSPLVISPSLVIPAGELSFTAVRASGPGGQNVNKVSTKVELRFDFERSRALPEDVKARLRAGSLGRVDAEGRLLVVSQATRDRLRNLEDARQKLASLVLAACAPPRRRRRPTRPARAAVESRLSDKRRRAEQKRARRGTDGGE